MKNPNTHRVYINHPDGRKELKASGKEDFCNVIAANHRKNGYESVVVPIPESDLR